MRPIARTTMVAIVGGLLAAGQALGAGASAQKEHGAGYGQYESSQQQISANQLDKEQIRELQQALKDKGADPGKVDGIIGPKTRQALRDFQQEQGLASTGNVNQEVVEALGLDAQEFMGVSPEFGEEESGIDSSIDSGVNSGMESESSGQKSESSETDL